VAIDLGLVYTCRIKMRARLPRQLELPVRTHGGRRKGAGRPRRSAESVPHARRPEVSDRHPLHVTLRVRRDVWNLRSERGFACVRRALVAEQAPGRLRIVQYSVQGNHLHLVVEADDRAMLSRRMQGFSIRLAKRINRMMGRARGRVLAERYHARALKTPTEVRNVLKYVLRNHEKHSAQAGRVGIAIDPFSSAPWFEHWSTPPRAGVTGPPPTSAPTSYLLKTGWMRAGGKL